MIDRSTLLGGLAPPSVGAARELALVRRLDPPGVDPRIGDPLVSSAGDRLALRTDGGGPRDLERDAGASTTPPIPPLLGSRATSPGRRPWTRES